MDTGMGTPGTPGTGPTRAGRGRAARCRAPATGPGTAASASPVPRNASASRRPPPRATRRRPHIATRAMALRLRPRRRGRGLCLRKASGLCPRPRLWPVHLQSARRGVRVSHPRGIWRGLRLSCRVTCLLQRTSQSSGTCRVLRPKARLTTAPNVTTMRRIASIGHTSVRGLRQGGAARRPWPPTRPPRCCRPSASRGSSAPRRCWVTPSWRARWKA